MLADSPDAWVSDEGVKRPGGSTVDASGGSIGMFWF